MSDQFLVCLIRLANPGRDWHTIRIADLGGEKHPTASRLHPTASRLHPKKTKKESYKNLYEDLQKENIKLRKHTSEASNKEIGFPQKSQLSLVKTQSNHVLSEKLIVRGSIYLSF